MDISPSTPGKFKSDKLHHHRLLFRHSPFSKLTLFSLSTLAIFLIILLFSSHSSNSSSSHIERRSLRTSSSWGGSAWEKRVRNSVKIRNGKNTVLVTGAAGFVGTHVSAALKRRGDGVLGLDCFNDYYEVSLKRSRQALLESRYSVFIVEGDINDSDLLNKLFDIVPFTHIMHLAAQAGVRYAMKNPASYVHSNVAGLVSIFEVAKSANPQPSIIWASSSSVYGLNTKVPFSETDRTDRPASLYAATKKAGEEIAHTYNHIYGLSITGLRFFTVYGPWGRPDMAYFFFTNDILKGNPIRIFEGEKGESVARDFTYIDDIVAGCLGALDTAKKSTGSGGKKKGQAQLRVYNLGNTSPVRVSSLVKILEGLLRKKANKKVVKMPANGDVEFTHANVSLAERELGYQAGTDLKTGLKRFVRWYVEYYDVAGFGDVRRKKDGLSFSL